MKSLNKHLKSLIAFATLPSIAAAFFGNLQNANAFSLADFDLNNIEHLRQVISQTNEPPDVIIGQPEDSGSVPSSPTTRSADTRFTCELNNGEYTVTYYPESQPDQPYPWAIPSELGGGWTPEKRCNEITSRFETYRQDGLLELSTGVENGYNTICVTTQLDPTDCRLILTVPPGQDPQLTRDLIFDNLLVADDGQQTQGVYTFGDNQTQGDIIDEVGKVVGGISGRNSNSRDKKSSPEAINLKPFLDPADGGTGQQLTRGSSATPSARPQNSERKPAIFK